jgi:hypothetical protein
LEEKNKLIQNFIEENRSNQKPEATQAMRPHTLMKVFFVLKAKVKLQIEFPHANIRVER